MLNIYSSERLIHIYVIFIYVYVFKVYGVQPGSRVQEGEISRSLPIVWLLLTFYISIIVIYLVRRCFSRLSRNFGDIVPFSRSVIIIICFGPVTARA